VTIAAGSRLGPYEILAALGAGGMGEVYRARDTRLERTVAIKVLPQHLSSSPEVRQRFEREAKTISQLSHPHICALYDVGHQDGVDYLVMELLEGETLADRLAKGALPLDQTLRFGIEIADALDKAHRQGIVHRDLKPGNVMLTRSGVKLLDFGLAKVMAPESARGSLTAMPTRADLTQEGTIVGTIQYMAPEQLEGKDADAPSDIFALGTVLYEMATGKKAFTGSSQASLISAIMTADPPSISKIQPMAPPAFDRLVRTCLAKDPDNRWQTVHDVMLQLKWFAGGSETDAPQASAPRGRYRKLLSWGLTVAALLLAAGALLRGGREVPGRAGPIRLSMVLPEKSALRAATLSPDGSKAVVVARDASGRNLLWIRSLDSLSVEPLQGTENPSFPFWSPDGRFIAFFADGKLKKIEATGGPPQTLCDAPISRGGSWGTDGVILFSRVMDGPIYRVSSSGGTPTAATRFNPSRGETTHRWPYFLPDGRHFLYLVASFTSSGEQEKMGIYAGSLDPEEEKFLTRANSSVAYAPPGYILFYRERNLFAQPFDARELRVTGEPFPVAEGIQYFPQTFNALFSVSPSGTLLYQSRSTSSLGQLLWFDRAGRQIGSLGEPGDQGNPRISPDGRRVTLDITNPQTGNMDIWAYESSGGIAMRLTSSPAIDTGAIWSPDGRRIVFMSLRQGHQDLFEGSSGGGGSEEALLLSGASKNPCDWSPDGRYILYRDLDPKANIELWTVPVAGDRKPVPFIKTSYGVSHGQFSPDGRFVAYASNETGRWEVYIAPFPGPGGNWQVSREGGSEPRWRRDGKEMFYIAADGHLMTVAIKESPTFDAGEPKPLFLVRRREPVASSDLFTYDVSADGQRFLVNTDVGETTPPALNVVMNWASEPKK
jgi:eukaryotic-like serine/threonine-protein kinase